MATCNSVNLPDEVPGTIEKICEPCEQENKRNEASAFCKHCNQWQCTDCVKSHDKYAFMKGHDIVPASAVSEITTKSKVDMKGLDKCQEHKKTLEFYCMDHKRLCCSSCAIEHHRKCEELNSLEKQVTNVKPSHNMLICKLEKVYSDAVDMINDLPRKGKAIRRQIDALPGIIDSRKNDMIKAFDNLKSSIIKKSETFSTDISKQIEGEVSHCERIETRTKDALTTLKAIAANGSAIEIYITTETLQDQIEQLMADMSLAVDAKKKFNIEVTVKFNPLITSLLQKLHGLGDLTINKCAPLRPMSLTLMTSVDVKQTGDDTCSPSYSGLAFLPDGRLVVLDHWNWKLYVMNESLEKLGKYKFDGQPQDVVVISADLVAVVLGGYFMYDLLILNISKTHTISLAKTMKVTSMYNSICMMNDTTLVVSTCVDKRPVKMITLHGKESDINGIHEKQSAFDASACTYIRKTDTLVITDKLNNAVYLYNMENEHMARRVVKINGIRDPIAACEGPYGTILVCSKDTNVIVRLSNEGKVIETFKLGMKDPLQVCMSQDGTKLAVSNSASGANKLNMYSIL